MPLYTHIIHILIIDVGRQGTLIQSVFKETVQRDDALARDRSMKYVTACLFFKQKDGNVLIIDNYIIKSPLVNLLLARRNSSMSCVLQVHSWEEPLMVSR